MVTETPTEPLVQPTEEQPPQLEDPIVPEEDVPLLEEEPADPLAGLAPEVLAQHPSVQALVQQQTQAAEERAQREAEDRQLRARSQWFEQGRYVQTLAQHLEEKKANGDPIDPGFVQQAVDAMWGAMSYEGYQTFDTVLKNTLPSDFTMQRTEVERLDKVREDVQRGRAPLDALIAARWEIAVRVYGDTVLKPQIRAELKAEETSARKTQTMQQAQAARAAQSTPTTGGAPSAGGGATGTFRSRVEMDQAHVDGRMTTSEYRQRRNSGEYDSLPKTA